MKVILASASPRRIKLLKKIFRTFSVIPSGVDEDQFPQEDPVKFALMAAEAKARAVAENYPDSLVIGADTIVLIDGKILGKPESRQEAREMLKTLSGKTHKVITAVVLYRKNQEKLLADYETTLVTFRELTDEIIENYLDKNTYQDKAGAYAVQELKHLFLEKLEGDYHNVVGLPLSKLRRMLRKFLEEKKEVEITSFLLPEGVGQAEEDGHIFQVPNTYPQDRVEIAYEMSERKIISARSLRLLAPSPFRRPAPCPHFGACGGCSFQDLDYKEQLKQKKIYLQQILKEYFPSTYRYLELEDIVPSPEEYYYRNKMEFSFGQEAGDVFLGLKEKTRNKYHSEKKVVRLEKCYISTPLTEILFPLFIQLVRDSGLPVFDLRTKQGFFRHLVVREGKQTGELMLILVTTSQGQIDLKDFTQKLVQAVPGLKSFWWVENNRVADVVSVEKSHLIYGEEAIEEKLLGFRFKIYPTSFFQTNPKAAQQVYARLVEEAKRLRTQSALGLYCGSGAIEICLSKVVGEVVGVDWDSSNIKAAIENMQLNQVKNARFLESSVEAVLPEIYRGSFDLLVIDPPRAGISPRGLKHIVSLRIPNLIYVSCNPESLARDLKTLSDSGYQINCLVPVDFFPHTGHLEVMSFLSR
ncbi:MAG: 23S rRNA (uracil(1939)-C(5))-methyltransferase RlmD [Candidatus Aminicenantes bacterium]|nr:23S rRNA (uracil(1939)-C(5))-methyltransferase RlmD [Candidatus Aminicenantes bacterium]